MEATGYNLAVAGDYKLAELDDYKKRTIYHEDIKERDFFSEEERKLLGI